MNLNDLIRTVNLIKQDMDKRALVLGTVQVQVNSEDDYSISSFNILTLGKFNQMIDNSELIPPRKTITHPMDRAIPRKGDTGFSFNNKF